MYQGQDIISETLSAKRGTRTFCTDSIVRKMSVHYGLKVVIHLYIEL